MKFDSVKSLLLLGAVGGAAFVAWKAYKSGTGLVSGAVDAVTAAADRVWNGPADGAQSYSELVAATKADGGLNPFVNNPNNVNPYDLIPAGYRVNQYYGLEPVGVFNSSNIAVNDARQIDRIMERQQATYAAMDANYAGAPTWLDDGRTGSW